MEQRPVVILRHPKERLSKCSLEPLRGRPGFTFYKAREGFRYNATGHLLLAVGAPDIVTIAQSGEDQVSPALEGHFRSIATAAPEYTAARASIETRKLPLLLLDATWRLLPQVEACVEGVPIRVGLTAPVETAYPRRSKISEDPVSGLASVEALYLALRLLGERNDALLDDYHWAAPFLKGLEGHV